MAAVVRVALEESPRFAPFNAAVAEAAARAGCRAEVAERWRPEEIAERLAEPLQCDVVPIYGRYVPSLAPRLHPLEELAPEATEGFLAECLELFRWQGQLFALPRARVVRLLYYRSDLFDDRRERARYREAADGRELRVPRSWPELAAVAQYFAQEQRVHGVAFCGAGPELLALFAEMVAAVGGCCWAEHGEPRFYSRAGEWVLTLLADLCGRWNAAAPETAEYTPDDVSEAFRMGRCALAVDTSDTARLLCDPSYSAVAGWHGVALLPGGDSSRASWRDCSGFAVRAGATDPAAARALVRELTRGEMQELETRHGALPARAEVMARAREQVRPGTLGHLRLSLAEQTWMGPAVNQPRHPGYLEAERAAWPVLRRALTGELEVVRALREAQDAAAAWLDSPEGGAPGGSPVS